MLTFVRVWRTEVPANISTNRSLHEYLVLVLPLALVNPEGPKETLTC